MGQTPCLEPEELKSSDLILVWSSNVKATRLHVMPILKEARAAGEKKCSLLKPAPEKWTPTVTKRF